MERNASRWSLHRHGVLLEASRRLLRPEGKNFDEIEKLMGRGTAEGGVVLKHVPASGRHKPSGGRSVNFPHYAFEGSPQVLEIANGKPGVAGEEWINKS